MEPQAKAHGRSRTGCEKLEPGVLGEKEYVRSRQLAATYGQSLLAASACCDKKNEIEQEASRASPYHPLFRYSFDKLWVE